MTSHRALLLPGGGYGAIGPVLRFPTLALEQRGVDVTVLSYPKPLPETLDRDDCRAFDLAVRDRIQRAVDDEPCDELTFVAKSRGTMVLGSIGSELRLPLGVNVIWLTPVFHLDYVREGAARSGWRSLVVLGGADPYYTADTAAHDEVVSALGAKLLVIESADHALEVPNDVIATLRAMERLAIAVLDFCREA